MFKLRGVGDFYAELFQRARYCAGPLTTIMPASPVGSSSKQLGIDNFEAGAGQRHAYGAWLAAVLDLLVMSAHGIGQIHRGHGARARCAQ